MERGESKICIQVEIRVDFKEEDNKVVAYVPGLDIATCGNTLSEAKKRFKEFIEMYLEELLDMGTLDKVLLESGWKKYEDDSGQVRWDAPKILERDTENIRVPCLA